MYAYLHSMGYCFDNHRNYELVCIKGYSYFFGFIFFEFYCSIYIYISNKNNTFYFQFLRTAILTRFTLWYILQWLVKIPAIEQKQKQIKGLFI